MDAGLLFGKRYGRLRMDRRTFNKLSGLAAIGAMTHHADAETATLAQTPRPYPNEIILEDSELLASFNRSNGALMRLFRKQSGWDVNRRPEFAMSFRLLAPLPHRRENYVFGQNQRLVSVTKSSDQSIEFVWKDLTSEHGGVLPITFRATVTLHNSELTFHAILENDSSVVIETVDYPYLGDLTPPTRDASMQSEHMWYDNLVGAELYPHFNNEKGYWGVDYPTKTVQSRQTPFCLIQCPAQGIYAGLRDPSQPYLLEYTFVQHPGVAESITNSAPQTDEIGETPVHLEFRTCHFVFVQPHTRRQLAPLVLRTYSGDWRAGVDINKQWRATWFVEPHIPDWIVGLNSWQQLQINAPEEDYTIPYKKLPEYIDECAANGVNAIQLVGWNHGGQDRGDPSQDTDPGLGTWQELHDAIAYGKQKNVKIILFAKLNWADMTTAWFRSDLYKYSCTDPYGIPYQTEGYSYFTPTQLAGINNRRREVMDFLCPAYREIAAQQFRKILNLGAEGWLFDEVCHHGPVEYSFSPNHGYTPPGYIYNGDMPVAKLLREEADKVSKDFLFAGEAPQDWLMQYYPVSYFRINAGSRAVARYIDSRAPLMAAVTGFDDREMLNLILLNRYIISYEPYNFKGRLSDFPLTVAYGKKIDALRAKYKPYLWDSEFRDTLGAEVSSNGDHRHAVFLREDGRRAVVVINMSAKEPIVAHVELPNPRPLVVATPERLTAAPTSGAVTIPARSAAVLMEQ